MQALARETVVIKSLAKLSSLILLVFAFYIQFHGKISPGGGFQAGIMLAMFFIFNNLIDICTASDGAPDRLPASALKYLAIIGISLYFLAAVFFSSKVLDYGVTAGTDVTIAQQWRQVSVFVVEIGIGMVVFAAMLLMYNSLRDFAINRRRSEA